MDYHDPTARLGAPPARSALGLRLALAIFGALTCTAGAVGFLALDAAGWAIAAGLLALIAVIDIVVITRRRAVERTE